MSQFDQRIVSHQQQQGVVLIAVLMIVLLLAIAAAIAIKSSNTSLGLTTTAQVNQLLFQSTDVPLAGLKETAKVKAELEKLTLTDMAPIRYLQLEGEQKASEYVLCYQPTSRGELYAANKHLILLSADGTTKRGLASGYCNFGDNEEQYFTSARRTVVTQVSLSRVTAHNQSLDGPDIEPFQASSQGTDAAKIDGSTAIRMRANVTSVLPSMSSNSYEDIDNCLKLAVGHLAGNTVTDNQTACLNATDVPKNIQVQDFSYQSNFE